MSAIYTLVKHFWLACAHRIPGSGKCERIHGHNFKVTFCIKGRMLDENQLLIDYRIVKQELEKRFDHQMLNDFSEFADQAPSTEKIAEVFFHCIDRLCQQKINKPCLAWVEVAETHEAFVRYEREEGVLD